MKKAYGTWSSAGVTSGTISFGPINGNSIKVINANVGTLSTGNTTNTAYKVVQGGVSTQSTIGITAAVSNDAGYWLAEWI